MPHCHHSTFILLVIFIFLLKETLLTLLRLKKLTPMQIPHYQRRPNSIMKLKPDTFAKKPELSQTEQAQDLI